jgi:flagellar hook protein FlgE
MGIYSALTNAVVGLQAQAYALDNISGNIANSSTTGYKEVDTAFEDLLTSTGTSSSTQTSGSVSARSVSTTSVQGSISSTSTSTDLAISGSGFFQVVAKAGESDGETVLGSTDYYTRQGDFSLSSEGYLVNTAGYYLTGIPVDAETGNVTGSAAEAIQIDTGTIAAKETTTIGYTANLPSSDEVETLGDATDYTNSASFPTEIAADDSDTFEEQSLAGGSISVYDEQGNEVDVELRWAKSEDDGTWSLYAKTSSTATDSETEWTQIASDFTFSSSGELTSPTSGSFSLSGVSVDGTDLSDVTFSYADGLTQYNSGTTVSDEDITQNGYASGTFTSLSISDGIVQATYSNGETISLYKVGVYTFNGESELLAVSGNAYQATADSGTATLSDNATIESSALESSNVDLTDQFSKMIITQQAYSANSKVMQTANSMMETLLNIVS